MINELFEKFFSIASEQTKIGSDVYVFSSCGDAPTLTEESASLMETKEKAPPYAALGPDSYGILTIVHMETGKKYQYRDVSPFIADKLRHYQKKKWYGKGWQMIRRFERLEEPKHENE